MCAVRVSPRTCEGKASADVRRGWGGVGGYILRGRPTRVHCADVCEPELLYKRTLAENTGGHRVRAFMVRHSVCTYVISINIYRAVFFGRPDSRFSLPSALRVHSLACSGPWFGTLLSELQNAPSAQRYWQLMFICRRAGEQRISF